MKQAVNSYSVGTLARVYSPAIDVVRPLWWIPRIPNYVWLAMIIMTISALSYSAYSRAREQEREARNSYSRTSTRFENARNVNQQIKAQTERIRQNPHTAAQVAQDQLRLIRRNEVVVSLR